MDIAALGLKLATPFSSFVVSSGKDNFLLLLL